MPSDGTAIHSGAIGSAGAVDSTSARRWASGSIRPAVCRCNTGGTVPTGSDRLDEHPLW